MDGRAVKAAQVRRDLSIALGGLVFLALACLFAGLAFSRAAGSRYGWAGVDVVLAATYLRIAFRKLDAYL